MSVTWESGTERRLSSRTLADIKPQAPQFLVPGRIPYGKITVLAGAPGTGKSQFTLALASHLSRHGVSSIFVGDEDGLEDTVVPRAMAGGANLKLIHPLAVEEGDYDDLPVILPTDVPLLRRKVLDTGASLVVIDPVMAHLSDETNSHNDHSIRRALSPLNRMARETGCAVVLIGHFKKGKDTEPPLNWIGGSTGLGGLARSAMFFGRAKDEQEDERDLRYVVHIKANGTKLAPTLICEMRSATVHVPGFSIETSHVIVDLKRTLQTRDFWAHHLA